MCVGGGGGEGSMLTNIWLEDDVFGLCSDRMGIEDFSSPAENCCRG